MKKELDLRGLTCPEPVLRTKKVIDDQTIQTVEVLVDSEVNVENLARLARSQNFAFSKDIHGDHFKVNLVRDASTQSLAQPATSAETASGGTIIFITRDTFGQGASASDHDFSLNLMNVFLQTAIKSGHQIRAVLLANSGVKLMDPNGVHHQVLQEIKDSKVEVLACGLCLDYYGLKDKVPVEQITNMFAICEYLFAAQKVLSP